MSTPVAHPTFPVGSGVDLGFALETYRDLGIQPRPGGVNEPFLREVLAHIEDNPERWDQTQWSAESACGTTHCLAGWAYVMGTGKEWPVNGFPFIGGWQQYPAHGPRIRAAAELLGFTYEQACAVFNFVTVADPDGNVMFIAGAPIAGRPVTFPELCDKVAEQTGVVYKPAPVLLTEADYR